MRPALVVHASRPTPPRFSDGPLVQVRGGHIVSACSASSGYDAFSFLKKPCDYDSNKEALGPITLITACTKDRSANSGNRKSTLHARSRHSRRPDSEILALWLSGEYRVFRV